MADKDYINPLFKNETAELKNACSVMDNENYRDNELMPEYKRLAKSYNRLLTLSKKIFRISDSQAKNIKRRESEIKNLLDNSNQGFLTFGADFLVNREYSSECYRIFNQKIANLNVLELLTAENEEQYALFKTVFTAVFQTEDRDARLAQLTKLPSMIKIRDNFINIKYNFIDSDDFQEIQNAMMLILTDITEKRKVEDQILYLSYHDKLTSLYNRAYIDSVMPQLQYQSNLPLSVIMADMNGLKLTNDVFGHEKGDQLLIQAAQVFKACCRKNDIIARWGGDEFLILLPGAGRDICARICGRIKEMGRQTKPDPIALSFALGIATVETLTADIAGHLNAAENEMYNNKLKESPETRKKIIFSVDKILHSKCFEDEEHPRRIKQMAARFGKLIGLEPDSKDMADLLLLAELHDIGKVAIPGEILGKPGSLTADAWQILKECPKIGYRMAQSVNEPQLAQAILAVRERWNGQGYPNGLKEEQIPLISRIISLIDAYDVMTHDRPYKPKTTHQNAVREIARCSGSQFDPRLAHVFLDHTDEILGNYAGKELSGIKQPETPPEIKQNE